MGVSAANMVSPKNRPWAKKTVMFPNPIFVAPASFTVYALPSATKKQKRSYKTRSPDMVAQTSHKFLVAA